MKQGVYMRLLECCAPAGIASMLARGHIPEPAKDLFRQAGEAYKSTESGIVLFTGGKRCGKTLGACAFIAGNVRCPNPNRFDGRWPESDRPLFLHFLDHHNFEFKQFHDWARPPVLVMDDLGAGMGESKMHKDLIFGLIQKRTQNSLLSVITSRLTLEQLGNRYDSRVAELVGEFGKVLTPHG